MSNGVEQAQEFSARLDEAIAAVPDFVYTFDLAGRFTYANPALHRLLRLAPGEIVGQNFHDLGYPADLATKLQAEIARVIESHRPVRAETAFEGVDGPGFYEYIFVPVFDAEGRVAAVAGTTREITERKQTEIALRESEKRLRLASEVAELGIWVWYVADGRVVWENDRMFEIYGLDPSEEPLRAEEFAASIAHREDAPEFERMLSAAVKDGVRFSYQGRFRRRDGEIRWIEFIGRMEYGDDGEPYRMFGTAADITARKGSQEALRKSDERYRAIFDSIDEGFCVIEMIFDAAGHSIDFRYLEINPAFGRLTGMSPDEIRAGKTIREMVPDYEQFWIDTYGRVAETGEPANVTHHVEGLGRWFEVSAAKVGDPDSRRVAVVFNDITKRMEAEKEQERLVADLQKERQKLYTLFENAPAFIAVLWGRNLVFEYVNAEYYKIVGHRPIVGLPLAEAMPEVVGGKMGRDYDAVLLGIMDRGEPSTAVGRPVMVQRTPGAELEERFLDLAYVPLRDEDGEVSGILVHGVDVTSQVRARRDVSEREELFRAVFEQAPDDAIVVMDAYRKITAWNPAAERICGWTAQEAIGQSADIIFTPEDRAAGLPERETFHAARRGKAADERWHQRKDGSRFWGSGTMNSLHQGLGTVRGYLKVFRDATERYESERQIRELNDLLETKVAQRTEELEATVREAEGFNYSIAHDLRTPLRAMAATSGILLEDAGPELSEEHRTLLVRQSENARRLGRLIDELLRLSRLARVEVNRRDLNLSEDARLEFEDLAEHEKTNGCEIEIEPNLVTTGDQGLVRTVFHNLIGNACKFSPSGGTVRVGRAGDAFFVSDEGVGFDMQFAPKIFLPFERLVREDEFPGTGIGLANVERIVRRHGGMVWVESEVGKGTTFYFTLGEPATAAG